LAVTRVKKRDGRVVDFDQSKITNAIYKALMAVEGKGDAAQAISDKAVEKLNARYGRPGTRNIRT
jgi:anaerobic ribonucleoside-triphosphate reductase